MRPGPVAQIALCVLLLLAGSELPAATGSQLFAACTACHGSRAEGNAAAGAPALAGQAAVYLERQLRNFRTGLRGSHKDDAYGAQMRAASQAALRDDAAVAAVAKYIAGLPRAAIAPAAKFDARNGNNLYQGKCGACHGGRAEGNDALAAPRLTGLDAAYLKRQLRYFRQGIRGAHANDRYGRQMALMAATVTAEADINDLIGYIHSTGSAR